jgi:hypothetical protein
MVKSEREIVSYSLFPVSLISLTRLVTAGWCGAALLIALV